MRFVDWVGSGIFLLLIGVGLLLFLCPHLLVQSLAKLQRRYYDAVGHTDETLDRMVQLPWDRFLRDGLSFSEFVREAELNPRRFAVLALFIRLAGGALVLVSAGVLLLAIFLLVTGTIK